MFKSMFYRKGPNIDPRGCSIGTLDHYLVRVKAVTDGQSGNSNQEPEELYQLLIE